MVKLIQFFQILHAHVLIPGNLFLKLVDFLTEMLFKSFVRFPVIHVSAPPQASLVTSTFRFLTLRAEAGVVAGSVLTEAFSTLTV